MTPDVSSSLRAVDAPRWPRRVPTARLFFAIAAGCLAVAIGLAWLLMKLLGRAEGGDARFAAAFAVTTALLLAGSWRLQQALECVRQERMALFRRRLHQGLAAGVLFMAIQTYALWTIMPTREARSAEDAALGVTPFVLGLAGLHGLHFLVATLFVAWVAAQAAGQRYDHEYHWGVTVCTWFWHLLGIVWLAILTVYAIAFRG